jgi:hypothetical protein
MMVPLLLLLLGIITLARTDDAAPELDWDAVGAFYTNAMIARAAACGATPQQQAHWATCATIDKPGCSRELQRFVTECISQD